MPINNHNIPKDLKYLLDDRYTWDNTYLLRTNQQTYTYILLPTEGFNGDGFIDICVNLYTSIIYC